MKEMFEKVNPAHPDKVADRIAGALVDLAYQNAENPKVAVEVLIAHGDCIIRGESSYLFLYDDVLRIVQRIAGENIRLNLSTQPQDVSLAGNQENGPRCGDNGIFKGTPVNTIESDLARIARKLYNNFPSDGKYILTHDKIIICQSQAENADIIEAIENETVLPAIINPLGYWTGGPDVDSGATNRKLGSDMGRSVTGGGLHGKDLSKADVAVNIFCHLLAGQLNKEVYACCAIGDENVIIYSSDGLAFSYEYSQIMQRAGDYINSLGGYEKFAEWGLI